MIQRRTAKPHYGRSGFTLIELLVVVAILALLAALSLGAVFKAIQLVRRGNTERTMQKVFQRFDLRMKAIATQARSGDVPTHPVTLSPTALTIDDLSCSAVVSGTPTHVDPDLERRRARVLYLKYLTKISFPMNFAEIQYNARTQDVNGNPIEPDPFAAALYLRFRNAFKPDPQWTFTDGNGFARARNVHTEFAGCLALIYAQLGSLDDMSAGEVIVEDVANLATGWNDGIPRICDAWGTPMRAYRWPTACTALVTPTNPVAYPCPPGVDPQDPEQLLNVSWLQNFASVFNNTFHAAQASINPGQTYVIHAPFTLVSAGPDRLFGFDDPSPGNALLPDPMSVNLANALDEVDNLYSFRFRLGVVQQGQ